MNHAAMLLTLFSIACVSSVTTAQTVSTRAPVVVQAQYVSSSSPMSDGRVVRTVYYPQAGQTNAYYVPLGSPTTVYSGSPECACEAAQSPVIQSPALPFMGSPAVTATYPQNTIYKPVLPLRRTIDGAYVSRGIWGQPKAYVPSEPVRNFFRYLLP